MKTFFPFSKTKTKTKKYNWWTIWRSRKRSL